VENVILEKWALNASYNHHKKSYIFGIIFIIANDQTWYDLNLLAKDHANWKSDEQIRNI